MTATVWVDASSGASGDMLLGALVGAGVPVEVLQAAVDAVAPEPVTLRVEDGTPRRARRHPLSTSRSPTPTTTAPGATSARCSAARRPARLAVFERLAVAEAAVHGTTPDDVHFHEVGALDAIADVVGVCAGFVHLGATERHRLARRRRLRHRSRPRTAPCPSRRRRSPSCCAASRRTPDPVRAWSCARRPAPRC